MPRIPASDARIPASDAQIPASDAPRIPAGEAADRASAGPASSG